LVRNAFRFLMLLSAFAALIVSANASPASASVTYVTQWGTEGPGEGQFGGPTDLAASPSGTIFVSDSFAGKTAGIQKFTSGGAFLGRWGSPGFGNGQFLSPGGIATGPSGAVYVGDYLDNRIQKFNSNGKFLAKWGTLGSDNGQFAAPHGIATDPSGRVYVVDYGNNRVQKFSPDGKFLDKWGSFGFGKGQFLSPSFIAADSSGHVYVADSGNSRIQKFSASGTFLDKWDSPGPGAGVPDYPQGIATDPSGDVYVVGTNSIQKYTSSGALLTRWGEFGKGKGQFDSPQGIATDSSGNVYVGDSGNNRVQKFHDPGPPYPDPGTARLNVPRPAPVRIRGGRKGRVRVIVKNTGSNAVKKVKVCIPLSARAHKLVKKVGCERLGSIDAGAQERAVFKIRARCRNGRILRPQVKASAGNADPAGTRVRIRITDCRRGPQPPLPFGLGAASASSKPSPPRLPKDFDGKGRYLVPDMGIDVPFSFRGSNGNVKMVAGGKHDPIWFMNIIYGKPGKAKHLYTVTYRWPGLVSRDPCSAIPGTFGRTTLNGLLARSSYVGKEILQGSPDRYVNHWRMTAVFPPLPPGKFIRLPIALADVYVDQGSPTTFRKVLHFGFQNLYDPELDEWFEMDTFRHKPGKVTLPKGCKP
jgi:sugar lactone lactonase YvrE